MSSNIFENPFLMAAMGAVAFGNEIQSESTTAAIGEEEQGIRLQQAQQDLSSTQQRVAVLDKEQFNIGMEAAKAASGGEALSSGGVISAVQGITESEDSVRKNLNLQQKLNDLAAQQKLSALNSRKSFEQKKNIFSTIEDISQIALRGM